MTSFFRDEAKKTRSDYPGIDWVIYYLIVITKVNRQFDDEMSQFVALVFSSFYDLHNFQIDWVLFVPIHVHKLLIVVIRSIIHH